MTQERRRAGNGLVVSILLALALWAPRASLSMEMELVDDTLFLYGSSITLDDWVRYRELTQGKQFSKVVLANQGGGRITTALGIADDLVPRRVTTIAVGYCLSACTYIFLAGERRQFAANWPLSRTRLGFHGTYHPFFGTPGTESGMVAAYYQSRLPKANLELITKALDNLPDRRGFLYAYHPSHRSHVSLCSGSLEEKCQRIADSHALSLGLITTAELAPVSLPQKLALKNVFLGIELGAFERISNPSDLEKHCPDAAPGCIRSMRGFLDRPLERALAISKSGKTGVSWNYNDARRAAWRAVYQCVRHALEPCRIAAVNDLVTHELYALWQDQSAQAIDALRKTPLQGIPEERYEQTELRMWRLRTDTFTGSTPESIPGVKEVATRELVKMLIADSATELVDVWCGDQTLPTAKCIFGGGLAYANPLADQAQEKLLVLLLDALAGGKPVVIFSSNSQSWLSANAALRAAKGGKNVYWYRGGVDAWRTASLPTVPTAPFGAVVE
jgi:rhodanese-related sulfurtransferase